MDNMGRCHLSLTWLVCMQDTLADFSTAQGQTVQATKPSQVHCITKPVIKITVLTVEAFQAVR